MTVTEVGLRAEPGFRRYLAARVLSAAAGLLIAVALPVLVYRLTESLTWTAAVVVVQALPYLLLALPAAVLADRWQPRRLILAAELAGAAALATVPVVWLLGGATDPAHVLGVACAVQTTLVLADAGDRTNLPLLVGEDATEVGRAALSDATLLTALLVPPLTGLAVSVAPPEPLLGLAVVAVLIAAVLLRGGDHRPRTGTRRPALRRDLAAGLRDGIRVLRLRRSVRTVTIAGVAHAVTGGAWFAMLLPWADVNLGVPATGDTRIALLISSWAIAAVIAGWLTPVLRRRVEPARLTADAMLVSLAAGLGVLACTHWLPAVLVSTLWGTAYWVVVFTAVGQRRKLAPASLSTRVEACARMLTRGAGYPAGAVLAAAVGVATDPRGGLAAALAVPAVALALTWRRLRSGDPVALPSPSPPGDDR